MVGEETRNVFSRNYMNAVSGASCQLMLERLFQSERSSASEGVFRCVYWVENIRAVMDEEWMRALLMDLDAVLYLRKFTNGIALDITRTEEGVNSGVCS